MENLITVTQINNYIKNVFEAEVMLQGICVVGEVSSYNISNGIAYFNIKDENALLPCVLFNAGKFDVPNIGDMILVHGSINFYVKGGKLSFNAVSIEKYGLGVLYEKFLELKKKLEIKGYFDESNKKQIPNYVKRIGVVTSSTGAVIQDIINVTTRRNSSVDIVLYPVKVQGVGAEIEISNGINFFSDYNVDVVIVARGGGSIEDLQPFNTEIVADATYKCNKPIVSAVGHETDYTIIDFVSDLRAPTPSAAAELVVYDKLDLSNNIIYSLENNSKLLQNKLTDLIKNTTMFYSSTKSITENIIKNNQINIFSLFENSNIILKEKIVEFEKQLMKVENKIHMNNPKAYFEKGYVKLKKQNQIIQSKKDVVLGDILNFELQDAIITTQISKIDEVN